MKLATAIASWIPVWVMLLATATSNYDHYLLSCGESSSDPTTNTFDGRTWISDDNSTFSTKLSSTMAASSINAAGANTALKPFTTARIFTTNFTYSFPVSPGPKFIRLFFNPSSYQSLSTKGILSPTDPYLTVVSSTGHRLLRNFSAYLSLPTFSDSSVHKEFYVHVNGSSLQLTFSPSTGSSYAFVNGIEVVSVPDDLYIGYPADADINLPESAGLETAYRLNVGGTTLGPNDDDDDMHRTWGGDDQYLSGFMGSAGLLNQTAIKYTVNYSAPSSVYTTFRWLGIVVTSDNTERIKMAVTWRFDLDLGFNYLVRLHWCEVVKDINNTGYRVFTVLIDDQIVEDAMDVYNVAPGRDKAMFRDYYVAFADARDQSSSRGVLNLTMHPCLEQKHPSMYIDILLNGLEIFKISKPDDHDSLQTLDGLNPSRPASSTAPTDQPPLPRKNSTSHNIPVIVGAVTATIAIALLLCFLLINHRRKRSKTCTGSSGTGSSKSKFLLFSFGKSSTTTNSTKRSGSSLPSHLCRRYSLSEIKIATSDFTPSLIIGHGGFGNVYKATLPTDSGPTPVAIKRLNPLSGQGAREFTTEIELLSKLRHLHLVSLIGYCDDSTEMILVYEFMAHGTLRDHLYPNPSPPLPWPHRLKICVAAARGLHYLHTGTHRMIIHRDVKSTNILLDHNYVAKVSDFGLSKLGPTGGESTHVSTAVKGSFGYVDPEYYRRQQLTEKSDVYSFGVVLFEVLSGRAAVNPALPKEQVNLRNWARRNLASDTLDTIVDPNLKGQIDQESLRRFGEVAESCVREDGASRPSMVDVIWRLEFALQAQMESGGGETKDFDSVGGDFFSTNNVNSPSAGAAARLILSSDENIWASSVNHSSSGLFTSSTTSDLLGGSTDVFSQIFKPEGR